jgi:hypothetical protein
MQKVVYEDFKQRLLYIQDFFKGGDHLMNPSSTGYGKTSLTVRTLDSDNNVHASTRALNSYLIPFDAESVEDFLKRQNRTFYFNLVSQVVNAYSDSVTSKVSRDFDTLEPFVNSNVDFRESTWSEFVASNAKFTALFGFTATYVDYVVPEGVNTLGGIIEQDAGPKCILINPLQFAWVVVSAKGEVEEFAWYESAEDTGSANVKAVSIRVVNRKGWKIVQGALNVVNLGKGMADLVVTLEGDHPTSLKGKLPVVFNFYDRDYTASYPLGKSLVNDLVDVARAVYNYNSMVSDIHKGTFPILTVPLARTGGVMPPKTEIAVGSANALPYDSETGTPNYISPSSEPSRELREHTSYIIRTAYQQLGLTLTLDSSAQIQSGEALKIRSREFESYASKFASNMLKFESKVLDLFNMYLGLQAKYSIAYPKTFSIPQTKEDFENAKGLLDVSFISNEGKVAALKQMISVALSLSDEEMGSVLEGSKNLLAAQTLVKVEEEKETEVQVDLQEDQPAS